MVEPRRCTLSIVGQQHRSRPGEDAFDREDCVRRVLTVRGRTGCVLELEPLPADDIETVCAHLKDSWCEFDSSVR